MLDIALDPTDGQGLAWVYEHVEVLAREDGDAAIRLRVRVAAERAEQVRARFAS